MHEICYTLRLMAVDYFLHGLWLQQKLFCCQMHLLLQASQVSMSDGPLEGFPSQAASSDFSAYWIEDCWTGACCLYQGRIWKLLACLTQGCHVCQKMLEALC